MEIFLDSADLNEIKELKELIDGITTNPSLIAKSGHKNKYKDLIGEICSIIDGPVSV
ncbi:MAG TPA: fructose-6-phosphate aldolase, partial [Wolbachia sp.]|nr:fructose-6-phosphate aldolase [Wolbachia sp.]